MAQPGRAAGAQVWSWWKMNMQLVWDFCDGVWHVRHFKMVVLCGLSAFKAFTSLVSVDWLRLLECVSMIQLLLGLPTRLSAGCRISLVRVNVHCFIGSLVSTLITWPSSLMRLHCTTSGTGFTCVTLWCCRFLVACSLILSWASFMKSMFVLLLSMKVGGKLSIFRKPRYWNSSSLLSCEGCIWIDCRLYVNRVITRTL